MRCLLLLVFLVAVARCDDWKVLVDGLGKIQGISFFDVNNGLAAGWQNLYRTSDGGATWTNAAVHDGINTERYQDIRVYGNYAVAAGYGDSSLIPGSSFSNDTGADFYKTDETHLRQLWYSVEQIPGHVGSFVKSGEWTDVLRSGSGISISSNGGRSWIDYTWGVDAAAVGVSFVSSANGWLAGGESPILFNTTRWRGTFAKTTNGGMNWEILSDVYDNYYYAGVGFADANNGWLLSVSNTGSTILKSTDGGKTWTSQAAIDKLNLKAIKVFSASEAWVVGGYQEGAFYHGQLMHTTNGGTSWSTYAMRGYILNNVDGVDPSHVWACGLNELDGGAVLVWVPSN